MNRIFREKHTDNFTVLPNAIFKSDLSLKAIGLLTYILHLPSDWVIVKTQLYKSLDKDGRQSIEGAWQELANAGFIKTVKQPRKGSNLPIVSYYVYDCPKKDADFQHAGFQHAGFRQRETSVPETSVRETGVLLSTIEQRNNSLSTKEQKDIVPFGPIDPCPTGNFELEEKKIQAAKKDSERLPIPDDSAEIRKERERYEYEIVPLLRNTDITDAGRKLVEYMREKKPAFYEPYKDLWNISAKKFDLQQVKKLSDGRVKKFKTRMKDEDFDFLEIMMAIKKSKFLKGDNQQGWKVTWNWIFENDTHYLNIIEGQYP